MSLTQRYPASSLVLFDIDGTLLRKAGPHHRQALEQAVLAVTGKRASTEGIPVHGMLDHDILTGMLRREGFSLRSTQRLLPEITAQAERIYPAICPDLRDALCPAVPAALFRLRRAGIALALVTGNLPKIAWTKMRRAGIDSHFRLGAFSGQSPTRGGLALLAMRQAIRQRLIYRHAPVALIGDHHNDVEAAKQNGIRAVAVATGLLGMDDLRPDQPDHLLEDLTHLQLEHVR